MNGKMVAFVMTNPANYPLSDGFLSQMPMALVERLRAVGWQRTRTLFFEIPYCAVSAAGAGIARDYEHRVFYEIFCATEGVISRLTESELRVLVDHEQEEAACAVGEAMHGCSGMTTLQAEVQRHEPEIEKLKEIHGVDTVRDTLLKAQSAASLKPVIPRTVLLFWVCMHLTTHYDQYTAFAMPMNDSMLSQDAKTKFMKMLFTVDREYGDRLPSQQRTEFLRGVAST